MLRTTTMALGLLIGACSTVNAEELLTELASIGHNPFERPPSLLTPGATTNDATSTLMSAGRLELKAVLVAGSGSQANISGRIMTLGEEVDGYRLTSVSLDGVELRHDGEKLVLRLDRVPEL